MTRSPAVTAASFPPAPDPDCTNPGKAWVKAVEDWLPIRRITVHEYYRMGELGLFAPDQWGVELGKKLADKLVPVVRDPGQAKGQPPHVRALLDYVLRWR